MKSKIVCLYCKDLKKPSKEHVVSDTLGSDLIILYVCKRCNNETSPLDRTLAWESVLTLPRILKQPKAIYGYSCFIADSAFPIGFVEASLHYPLTAKMKTQLAFVPQQNNTFAVHGKSDNPEGFRYLFNLIRKAIRTGKLHKKLKILNLPDSKFL